MRTLGLAAVLAVFSACSDDSAPETNMTRAAQEPSLRRAPVDGGEIEYLVSGPEDGAPVLFIHGAGLADSFALVIEEPPLAGYQRIAVHRRGYGASTEVEGFFSLADQAADVVGLLDARDVERAHVVGHSSGGSVALQLAQDAPERIASLTVIEPARVGGLAPLPDAGPVPPGPDFALVQRANELYAAGDAEGAVEAFFIFAMGDDWRAWFDAVPGGYEQAVADVKAQFAIEGQGIAAWRYGPEQLRAIRVPTLVMGGGDSVGDMAPALQRAIQELIPDAELSIVEGTDHALVVQKPDAVAAAIADFVGRHPL